MTTPSVLGTLDGRAVYGMRSDTGTRLIAIHDPSARIISMSLGGVPAGMRHEMPGEEGMLHLLEHMVYQDSENVTASERQVSVHKAGGESSAVTRTWTIPSFTKPVPVDTSNRSPIAWLSRCSVPR